jgi:hypothetical protein
VDHGELLRDVGLMKKELLKWGDLPLERSEHLFSEITPIDSLASTRVRTRNLKSNKITNKSLDHLAMTTSTQKKRRRASVLTAHSLENGKACRRTNMKSSCLDPKGPTHESNNHRRWREPHSEKIPTKSPFSIM